ncbi:dihydroxyacetone kinase subunit DhaK [Vibrio vulnificus]|nr:DAK2 domain-containing protein [Vibrio vulnificus]EKO5187347.1 dihydroxyacetone kinase subunit DhaK [Vibrio vulnificus]ELH7804217.1 dihydroxyacetone kinase subunit DhaK [Vibrio vulnificus]MCU8259415.1 dihydroxyacetone kinase subunit DhaK [Vibrio vulnificus]MCU8421787.1 dihydroxyacetone kinase subunit DhaK [Vibrio vulnificus]
MADLILNNKESFVMDSIQGTLYTSTLENLTFLDFENDIKVVARNDWNKEKVALICGGGSGHEPAHAGFVGKGMLTAAVCGDLFAAPSVDSVLNAILHVTGDAGCLVIIKNYTGDRLNFGLAVEKAKEMGRKVDLIVVGDDISIPGNPQPRGIAGTLFVQKVAGYVAENGGTLEEVKQAALDAHQKTASIGVALTSCSLPGESNDRIAQGKAELGLGIHGEAGIETIDLPKAIDLVTTMVSKLLEAKPTTDNAILLNNLGGLSPIEMNIVAKEVMESELGKNTKFIVSGALMTAIDMKGFSISTIQLTDEIANALVSPVETAAWPGAVARREVPLTKCGNQVAKKAFTPSHDEETALVLTKVCQAIIDIEGELNHLDSIVGDGDTGSTFAAGARKVLAQLEANNLPLQDKAKLMTAIADCLTSVMGGSSGVLLSIMFTAAGRDFEQNGSLPQALKAGLGQMMAYGGAKPGDRTMIDALHPALEAWVQEGFVAAIAAAKAGAEATVTMTSAKAGRSSYLNSDSLNGTKDPGAFAVETVFSQF